MGKKVIEPCGFSAHSVISAYLSVLGDYTLKGKFPRGETFYDICKDVSELTGLPKRSLHGFGRHIIGYVNRLPYSKLEWFQNEKIFNEVLEDIERDIGFLCHGFIHSPQLAQA